MKEKVIIVVQCRADSTRLPRKIIRAISDDGKSCLQYLCERLNTAHYNTVVATTDRKEDTCIEKEFDDAVLDRYPHVLKVFKGSYENIAQRLYDASKGYEYIVRVTGDDLFTDIDCLHKLDDYGVAGKYDYTYQQGMIRGADCELIKRSALRRVLDKFPGEPIEHLEHYLKNDDFTIGCAPYPPVYSESSGIRLTLDNEKDYELCRIVYSSLYPFNPVFSLLDVVVFFNKYKCLKMLNFVPPISVYLVHRNYSDFVSDAIASVLGQTFRDFELIIVDYGSDHLGHVDPILKFLPNEKIKFYRIAEEITFIEAIQFALQRCRGRYVLRMDADDLLTPGALEALHKYLETHPEFSMVVPNYYEHRKNSNVSLVQYYHRR